MKNLFAGLFSFLFFASCGAQNLSLSCNGVLKITSTIGIQEDADSRTYQFIDGKLYGYIPATWRENSILVTLPRFESETMVTTQGFIEIDRFNGTVYDSRQQITKKIKSTDKPIEGVFVFKGQCTKGSQKF